MCKYCKGLARLVRHADHVSHPKKLSSKAEALGFEQAERIIDELGKESDSSLADIALIAVQTGLRMQEIAALRWADIDLGQKVMTVNGKAGIRAFQIPDPLVTRLMQIRTKDPGSARLFNSGFQSLASSLNRALLAVCKRIGIAPVRARCLRLTFLSRAHQSTRANNS